MSAAKNWVFTINNYRDNDIEKLEKMFDHGHFSYIVYGKEVGEHGTPHIQGYVQLKKKMRMAQVKKFISSRAHLEVSRGSPEQAPNKQSSSAVLNNPVSIAPLDFLTKLFP